MSRDVSQDPAPNTKQQRLQPTKAAVLVYLQIALATVILTNYFVRSVARLCFNDGYLDDRRDRIKFNHSLRQHQQRRVHIPSINNPSRCLSRTRAFTRHTRLLTWSMHTGRNTKAKWRQTRFSRQQVDSCTIQRQVSQQ